VRRMEGDDGLALANPAPGYDGIGQTMNRAQYETTTPVTGILLVVPPPADTEEEDPAVIAELQEQIASLETRLGYCQGDCADAIQAGLDGARAATDDATRAPAYDAIQAGINSLRNT